MSAELLGIAFRAKMGSHSRKLILLRLVDHAHDDGTHIFPGNESLAAAAECSERQVQRELRNFERAGLLSAVANEAGGRGRRREYVMSVPVLRDLADVDFPSLLAAAGEEAGDGSPEQAERSDGVVNGDVRKGDPIKGDTRSPFVGDEKGDTGDPERVTPATPKGDSGVTRTLKEPSSEPSEGLRESAGAGGQERVPDPAPEDDPKFRELLKRYPGVDDPARCFPAWLRLDAEGRRRALARLEAYVAGRRQTGKTTLHSLENYLRSRLFDQVDEPADGKPVSTLAPARSREWWALVWRALALAERGEGRTPKFFWEQARQAGTGWGVPVMDLPDEAARSALVGIECGSPEFEAWKRHLAERGLRMAADEPHLCGKFIYVPSEWPEQRERSERVANGPEKTPPFAAAKAGT